MNTKARAGAGTAAIRSPRAVVKKIVSREQGEGVGARVRRSIGSTAMRTFDPFLMLDEFRIAPPAGFPDHPHRGFSTVTLMLSGAVIHEDFAGHKGVIQAGDLQWMCAGKGIVHSEMPASRTMSHGLQLWVNLKHDEKLVEPEYQELVASDIPVASDAGVRVRVIAGTSLGVTAAIRTRTPVTFLQVFLEPGAQLNQALPHDWNVFVYTLSGQLTTSNGRDDAVVIPPHHTVIYAANEGDDGIVISNDEASAEDAHCVIVAGKPIAEPIVQHGPFVMCSEDEIVEAIQDYRHGRNGFERARHWSSESGKSLI